MNNEQRLGDGWPASWLKEDPILGSVGNTKHWQKMVVQLLQLLLEMNLENILMENSALQGVTYQAFEESGENGSYKDKKIGWYIIFAGGGGAITESHRLEV